MTKTLTSKLSNSILIDASWWLGGNRTRGIGRYLNYYFQKYWGVAASQRVWFFYQSPPPNLLESFRKQFKGRIVIANKNVEEALKQTIVDHKIESVFISSPFERPFSLIDFLPIFEKHHLKTTGIIFDLIPHQFPKQVLGTWSSLDQQQYLHRISLIKKLNEIECISPQTSDCVKALLKTNKTNISTIPFGTTTKWIEISENISNQPSIKKPLVVTISGGQWRKNLDGTLKYFAQHYAKTHQLIIICKLSKKEKLKFIWLTFELGIAAKTKFVGEVSDQKKWHYLKNCDVFLFLSHAEGLGIPVLEAKKAGVKKIITAS